LLAQFGPCPQDDPLSLHLHGHPLLKVPQPPMNSVDLLVAVLREGKCRASRGDVVLHGNPGIARSRSVGLLVARQPAAAPSDATSVLIGRDGNLIGKNRKICLPQTEIDGGLAPEKNIWSSTPTSAESA
jgi:predicted amidohydrolase